MNCNDCSFDGKPNADSYILIRSSDLDRFDHDAYRSVNDVISEMCRLEPTCGADPQVAAACDAFKDAQDAGDTRAMYNYATIIAAWCLIVMRQARAGGLPDGKADKPARNRD